MNIRKRSNSEEIFPRTIKLLLVGSSGIGKQCLIYMYVQGCFIDPAYHDFGLTEEIIRYTSIDGGNVKTELDLHAFGEYLDRKINIFDGFLLCFSLDNLNSFNELSNYYQEILHAKNDVKPPIILVGTKCDIEESQRQVSKEAAEAYASELGCEYFETSSLINFHVNEAFECITQKTYDFINPMYRQNKKQSKKEKKNKDKDKEVCLI